MIEKINNLQTSRRNIVDAKQLTTLIQAAVTGALQQQQQTFDLKLGSPGDRPPKQHMKYLKVTKAGRDIFKQL